MQPSSLSFEVVKKSGSLGTVHVPAEVSHRPIAVGSAAELAVEGEGIVAEHLLVYVEKGRLLAASVSAETPAFTEVAAIPTDWVELDVPCDVLVGDVVLRLAWTEPPAVVPPAEVPSAEVPPAEVPGALAASAPAEPSTREIAPSEPTIRAPIAAVVLGAMTAAPLEDDTTIVLARAPVAAPSSPSAMRPLRTPTFAFPPPPPPTPSSAGPTLAFVPPPPVAPPLVTSTFTSRDAPTIPPRILRRSYPRPIGRGILGVILGHILHVWRSVVAST